INGKNELDPILLEEFLELDGFDKDQFFLIELPAYCKASAGIWWEKVIRPYLELPATIDKIRGTDFYFHLLADHKVKQKVVQAAIEEWEKHWEMKAPGFLQSLKPTTISRMKKNIGSTHFFNQSCKAIETPSRVKRIVRELKRRCENQVLNSLAPA